MAASANHLKHHLLVTCLGITVLDESTYVVHCSKILSLVGALVCICMLSISMELGQPKLGTSHVNTVRHQEVALERPFCAVYHGKKVNVL